MSDKVKKSKVNWHDVGLVVKVGILFAIVAGVAILVQVTSHNAYVKGEQHGFVCGVGAQEARAACILNLK